MLDVGIVMINVLCPIPKFNMKEEYRTFNENMLKKGIKLDCDQQRFESLCVNPQIDAKSMIEAKGCLQA